jgi:hypothetical protein
MKKLPPANDAEGRFVEKLGDGFAGEPYVVPVNAY